MELARLYTKRIIKNALQKQNLITILFLLALLIGLSLTISFLPLTPSTKESLRRLAENYFALPPNKYSIALAFFAIEFPPLLALFASVVVSIIPSRIILYERASGNMEILLSYYSDIRKIVYALIISSLILAGLIYLIFMISGIGTILAYETIYHQFFRFPPTFYMFLFVLDPVLIIVAVSISLLLTILFPRLSSIERYFFSSNPIQVIAYLPSLFTILLITFIPVSPQKLGMFMLLASLGILLLTLFLAKKTMKRDVLVRK